MPAVVAAVYAAYVSEDGRCELNPLLYLSWPLYRL